MLTNLYIKNFALIEELSVAFSKGLTIITGETGAGKSILIGALNQILGIRANTDLVRSGSDKAVIEAILTPEKPERLTPILEEAGIDPGEEIILRREISAKGQSRCFINDTPGTLQVLKKLGDQLVDLHGQHEHQLLLHPETHLSLLDEFGQLNPLVESYQNVFKNLKKKRKELERVTTEADRLKEKQDLLEYQYKELDLLELKSGEQADIEEEIILHENAETRFSLCSSLSEQLYDDDLSAFVLLSEAVRQLDRLSGIDKSFSPHLQDAVSAKSLIEELSRAVRDYSDGIEFNPEKLDQLRERHMQLQRAVKKYGRPIEELIAFKDKISAELSPENDVTERTEHLRLEIDALRTTLSGLAVELSSERQKTAAAIEKAITRELGRLGIPHSVFCIRITQEVSEGSDIIHDEKQFLAFENGYDRVEFLLSTNIGESPKPLAKIASGGEISRVMLAMKSVLAENTQLPILIFDEIDTGISGAVADAVGRSLRKLSRTHQIISITHLPQIAAMADNHLSVEKNLKANRTVSTVRKLNEEDHISAVADLLSGRQHSESSLLAAAELVELAKGSG
ncbi:MAG: DNA repair protein RecN [Chlorobium phaeobacteroides]|uniref:DNA repair protein RecN n=1 Tax=Chlorobium phaeobacteroides (strain BS1) TaxID=331678 RepID=B3EMS5_CHLPB|nr:DNA repair protein RecN [Chlorobium phaeobacteroides]